MFIVARAERGRGAGRQKRFFFGAHPRFVVKRRRDEPDERFLARLHHMKRQIAASEVEAHDRINSAIWVRTCSFFLPRFSFCCVFLFRVLTDRPPSLSRVRMRVSVFVCACVARACVRVCVARLLPVFARVSVFVRARVFSCRVCVCVCGMVLIAAHTRLSATALRQPCMSTRSV